MRQFGEEQEVEVEEEAEEVREEEEEEASIVISWYISSWSSCK